MSMYHRTHEQWINQRFGNQTILGKIGETEFSKGEYRYITDILSCRCDCSHEREITAKSLVHNKSQSCRYCSTTRIPDPIGEVSGSLMVLSIDRRRSSSGRSVLWFHCSCSVCGNTHEVKADIFRIGETGCPNCSLSSRFIPGKRPRSLKRMYSSIKRRAMVKGLQFDLTVEFLESLMDKQGDICSLSGVEISVADGTASLDRIDNRYGYIRTNVQWVHRYVNFMKVDLPESEFVRFCSSISDHMSIGHQISSISEQP
jgi:hypothetical protein